MNAFALTGQMLASAIVSTADPTRSHTIAAYNAGEDALLTLSRYQRADLGLSANAALIKFRNANRDWPYKHGPLPRLAWFADHGDHGLWCAVAHYGNGSDMEFDGWGATPDKALADLLDQFEAQAEAERT